MLIKWSMRIFLILSICSRFLLKIFLQFEFIVTIIVFFLGSVFGCAQLLLLCLLLCGAEGLPHAFLECNERDIERGSHTHSSASWSQPRWCLCRPVISNVNSSVPKILDRRKAHGTRLLLYRHQQHHHFLAFPSPSTRPVGPAIYAGTLIISSLYINYMDIYV